MKRAVTTTFLLFYAAFTVAAISEHTASYASTVARHSSGNGKSIRASSPHTPQVRILQDPFVGPSIKTAFTFRDIGSSVVRSQSLPAEVDFLRFTPTRAPPANFS